VSDQWTRHVTDPDGRTVVFDVGSHLHLAERRPRFLDHVDVILGTVERPDHRGDDRVAGRERFYRADFPVRGRWLRVVVDFNDEPGWIVTALDQDNDPRLSQR
jgi:hypothetical protein